MRFASLGSGSQGNGLLVQSATGRNLLLDCGFSVKETRRRLLKLDLTPDQLSAIIVTHEHSDHIKGVASLARQYKLPLYTTAGTARSHKVGELSEVMIIHDYQPFIIEDILVQPVPVPHDAREPAQFIFQATTGEQRLGVLTDLGHITPHIEAVYQNCDALILEANHDPMMLASGPYPRSLKQRVSGFWGHLSNQQAQAFLQKLETSRLQHLIMAHISQQNNSVKLVEQCLDEFQLANVLYACQDQGFHWLEIDPPH